MEVYHRGHNTSDALLRGSFKGCCITRTWRGREDIGDGNPKDTFQFIVAIFLVQT